MDKYVCVDVELSDRLTLGKVYEKLNTVEKGYKKNDNYHTGSFLTTNDKSEEIYYNENRFVTLEEYREIQINKLIK